MSRPDIRSFRMLLLFLVLTALPIAAFGWLGWRFLQQDRDLESQRQRERLQNASELLARELQTQLEKAERAVSGGTEASGTPSAATFFHLRLGRLVARSGTALPFYPVSAERDEHPAIFETAERQEFDGHCDAAIGTYKGLSKSTDAGVRAGALVRSARCLRKLNRDLEALETYKALLALGGTSVVGMPAALLARRERLLGRERRDRASGPRDHHRRQRQGDVSADRRHRRGYLHAGQQDGGIDPDRAHEAGRRLSSPGFSVLR